jgi:hypothetical protein
VLVEGDAAESDHQPGLIAKHTQLGDRDSLLRGKCPRHKFIQRQASNAHEVAAGNVVSRDKCVNRLPQLALDAVEFGVPEGSGRFRGRVPPFGRMRPR